MAHDTHTHTHTSTLMADVGNSRIWKTVPISHIPNSGINFLISF